ncbi:MAG: hypothetical protein HY747_07250 [Elusimicrobia bacterium]|nr:hypothetical protein [Elusimicrobiota bacterium]
MVIWLIERPNRTAQAQCLEFLARRANAASLEQSRIQWRILPAGRLWSECVDLVKKESYPANQYPSIIEYPLAWHESIEYLKILAQFKNITFETERWLDFGRRVFQNNFSATALIPSCPDDQKQNSAGQDKTLPGAITFPWLIGLTALFYRKDVLRSLNKTPEALETYSGWVSVLREVRQTGDLNGLDMSVNLATALWWIFSHGGLFLDPLNLMPSFHQAEAQKAIEEMLEALLPNEAEAASNAGCGFGLESDFPERSFCLLSSVIPAAVMAGDPRVGCLLPPKITDHAVIADEYALAVTKKGLERHQAAVLNLLETWLGDGETWVDAARQNGLLPAQTVLWEPYFNGVSDSMAREVFYAAVTHLRWVPRSPFFASLTRIFEESLGHLFFTARREGTVDARHIAADMAKAVAEYRLIAALYGPYRQDHQEAASAKPEEEQIDRPQAEAVEASQVNDSKQ